MKKKLCFLLACCFILVSFVFSVNAENELEAYMGKPYEKDMISVLSTPMVNPDDYVGEGPFDLFGVSIIEMNYMLGPSEIFGEKEMYTIKISPEVDIFEACEILNQKEGIIGAEPCYIENAPFDWGEGTVDSISPFIDMTDEELRTHWRFIPNEVTVCLDYELDLTEFEGEGEHYLFGVLIGEISRVEDADGFVYNILYGNNINMTNDQCYYVFNSNEHVLWTEYETMYANGDINEDGKIDSLDYLFAKRICFGTYTPTYFEYGCIDFNVNGTVDSVDYLLLKRACFNTYTPADNVVSTAE